MGNSPAQIQSGSLWNEGGLQQWKELKDGALMSCRAHVALNPSCSKHWLLYRKCTCFWGTLSHPHSPNPIVLQDRSCPFPRTTSSPLFLHINKGQLQSRRGRRGWEGPSILFQDWDFKSNSIKVPNYCMSNYGHRKCILWENLHVNLKANCSQNKVSYVLLCC